MHQSCKSQCSQMQSQCTCQGHPLNAHQTVQVQRLSPEAPWFLPPFLSQEAVHVPMQHQVSLPTEGLKPEVALVADRFCHTIWSQGPESCSGKLPVGQLAVR